MWRKREEPKQSQPAPAASASQPSTPPTSAQPAAAAKDGPTPMSPSKATLQPVAAVPQPVTPQVVHTTERSASLISKGLSVSGEVTGSEDLQVDGELRGTLKMAGARVTITPSGRASATIEAREVVIRGNITGNIRATERVVVGNSGVWQGDAVAPRLMIEEGAIIHGKFEVAQPKESKRGNQNSSASEREELVTNRVGAN